MAATKHTLVALVEDRPGVLNRMASLFRRRGFNIESITVGHSEVPHLSRMTIVVDGHSLTIEKVVSVARERKKIEIHPDTSVHSVHDFLLFNLLN